uniref:Uncharacterized protein n=1 Tax=Pipistrellus kuhlii TaxID=59472 RepID=A0A7J7XAR1_PIPKU|nr:hypothetical protein mPipKuh1_010567 [Pipistrellus kuhlii]
MGAKLTALVWPGQSSATCPAPARCQQGRARGPQGRAWGGGVSSGPALSASSGCSSAMERAGAGEGGPVSWERSHLPSEMSPDCPLVWKEVRCQMEAKSHGQWVTGDEGTQVWGWLAASCTPSPCPAGPGHRVRVNSGQRPRLPGAGPAGLSCDRLGCCPA